MNISGIKTNSEAYIWTRGNRSTEIPDSVE